MRSEKKIIAVQSLGGVRGDVVQVVAANLQVYFEMPTQILLDQPVPDQAYNPHRGQYNCYPILEFLGTLKPNHAVKIIGVTDVDLFIPILTYVFGEAQLGGQATVISTYRLAKDEWHEPVAPPRLYDRTAKIAVHEMAHTFHLPHCKEDRCIMSSFPVLSHIDEKPIYFCRYCVRFLQDAYENLGLVEPPGFEGG